MTRDQIRSQVEEVFREVFQDDALQLEEQMTAIDVEGWDSLTHVNLIIALEKRLAIKFAAAVFFFLNSVRQRQVCLAVFSVLFLMTQSVNGPGWLLLVAFLASGYAAG